MMLGRRSGFLLGCGNFCGANSMYILMYLCFLFNSFFLKICLQRLRKFFNGPHFEPQDSGKSWHVTSNIKQHHVYQNVCPCWTWLFSTSHATGKIEIFIIKQRQTNMFSRTFELESAEDVPFVAGPWRVTSIPASRIRSVTVRATVTSDPNEHRIGRSGCDRCRNGIMSWRQPVLVQVAKNGKRNLDVANEFDFISPCCF